MADPAETRADVLMRTSEIYRRMRSDAAPVVSEPPVELARDRGPVDTARALPPETGPALPPPGPTFLRRMLTRRPDIREVVLLVLVAAALLLSRG